MRSVPYYFEVVSSRKPKLCVRIHSIRDTTIFESLNNSKNCIINNFTIDYNLLGIYCTVIKSDLLL